MNGDMNKKDRHRGLPAAPPRFVTRNKRIGIFIIAYDAQSNIEQTLARIPVDVRDTATAIYVFDDCSRDDTVGQALKFKEEHPNVVVLRNRVNQRYGGNQKLGYQYAIDNDLDVVVMLHADGQYAPEILPEILEPILRDRADVVIGSRMLNKPHALKGGMPRYKYFGNIILTRIQNRLSGMKLSEFHSGYRAYSVRFLRQIPFWENSNEWHFDSQILLQAHRYGARIEEVPIPTYYGDEICHVNGMVYAVNCVLSAMEYWLFRKNLFYSRNFDLAVHGSKYFGKFSDPYSSHSIILAKLMEWGIKGKRILELGTGDASLTKRIAQEGASIDGIEVDAVSAELARPYCRSVKVDNLDNIASMPNEDKFDIIIAADVLEHLRDPEVVLSHLKRFARRDGILIVSLPNIANLYVRLNILLGRFPYHTKGILDQDHLHFYTIKTARRLIEKTGWIIEGGEVTSIPIAIVFPFLLLKPLKFSLSVLHAATRCFKGLLAYQSVWYCRNTNDSWLL